MRFTHTITVFIVTPRDGDFNAIEPYQTMHVTEYNIDTIRNTMEANARMKTNAPVVSLVTEYKE